MKRDRSPVARQRLGPVEPQTLRCAIAAIDEVLRLVDPADLKPVQP